MPRLRAGHVALGYADEGSGEAVCLVHGFTLDHTMWDDQAPALLAAGYRVVRHDLRGHGTSDAPPTGYTVDDHAGDVLALLDKLGIASAHLVGLSLGGGVAAAFAARWPRRLRSLTLIDATLPGRRTGAEREHILSELRRRALAGDVKGALHEQWARSRLFHPTRDDPAALARLLTMCDRFSSVQFHDLVVPPPGSTVAERLGEIDTPTLVLVGALDMPEFHEIAQAYAEQLPQARLQVIAAAGHMATMDNPRAVNAALLGFLREVDGRA